jgi:biopolymer transport protein ExbD
MGMGVALVVCSCAPPDELPPPSGASAPPVRVDRRAERHPWLNQLVGLAPSKTGTLPVRGLPMIVLTTRELRLVGADRYALPLPPRAEWSWGFPASEKSAGADGWYLFRFGRWLARTRRPRGKDVDLMVDREIPYRLFIETLVTGGRSGYQRFHLIVQGPKEPAQIVVRLPVSAASQPAAFVAVSDGGVAIRVPGDNVVPGCGGAGSRGAASAEDVALTEAVLERCLGAVVERAPLRATVLLSADPDVAFGRIIAVLDVVREVRGTGGLEFGLPIGARAGH